MPEELSPALDQVQAHAITKKKCRDRSTYSLTEQSPELIVVITKNCPRPCKYTEVKTGSNRYSRSVN
jgi:hypothetical protein